MKTISVRPPQTRSSRAPGRLPVGLTFSMFVAAVSVACLTLFGGVGFRGGAGPSALVHTSAALALVWAVAAFLLGRKSQSTGLESDIEAAAGSQSAIPNSQFTLQSSLLEDARGVLQIATLATALLAVIVMLYMASIETICRTVYAEYRFPWQVNIWSSGLLDLGMILAAALLSGWAAARSGASRGWSEDLPTILFWLLILAGLWGSFLVPGFRVIHSPGGIAYEVTSDWASLFVLSCAVTIAAFTVLAGYLDWRGRVLAWPHALDRLTAEPVAWSGFRYSAGLLAVVVLVLSCVHISLPWTIVSAFLAGGSMLALTHRRWHDSLADTGFALITLGVVALLMLGLPRPVWSQSDYASLLNRAVGGLAIMTAFWHWLAGVWAQQLDNGRPWTTAGRLISVARRVGFLVGVTGVLFSLHLSLWPSLPLVVDPDTALSRWVFGLLANGLLVLALLFSARRTSKSTLAWLTLFAAASGVLFVVVRMSESARGLWWAQYWPLVMVGVAGAALVVAGFLSRRPSWRPFITPLTYTGVIIAPLAAILGASPLLEHVPRWMPLATLGGLSIVYLLAAVTPGPSTFTAVAALCAVAGLWELRQLVGSTVIPNPYFYGTLMGLCLTLVALSYQHQARPRVVRSLRWMGGLLLLSSIIGGLIAGAA